MQLLVWINIILLGMIVLLLSLLLYRVSQIQVELAGQRIRAQVRIGAIARSRTTKASPKVDSRARTVVRDSNDLPLTGRMSEALSWKKP